MGCTTSVDGAEPKRKSKNLFQGGTLNAKPLLNIDKVRIQMVLDYWYHEQEWTDDKHQHYLKLMQGGEIPSPKNSSKDIEKIVPKDE